MAKNVSYSATGDGERPRRPGNNCQLFGPGELEPRELEPRELEPRELGSWRSCSYTAATGGGGRYKLAGPRAAAQGRYYGVMSVIPMIWLFSAAVIAP